MVLTSTKMDDLTLEEYNEIFYKKKFSRFYNDNLEELVEFLDSDSESELDKKEGEYDN